MNWFLIILAGALTCAALAFALKRWVLPRYTSSDTAKHSVPKRLWRRGTKYNSLELFENPDGSKVYHIHRLFSPKCPRCLERNYSGWTWTVPFKEGVDPCSQVQVETLSYHCTRCKDVQTFVPQIGPSEWYDV